MTLRLLAHGHAVTIWNRDPAKRAAAVARRFALLDARREGVSDPAAIVGLYSGRPG